MVLHLDFKNVYPRNCNFDKKKLDDGDFEEWTPKQMKEGCVFGERVTFYRRKQESMCYIPKEMEPFILRKSCECSPSDFVCDTNHFLNSEGKCVLDKGKEKLKGACDANGYYQYSTGYRKTTSNNCKGGDALDEGKKIYCGTSSFGSFVWGFFKVIFYLAILAGIVILIMQYGHLIYNRTGSIRLPPDVYGTPNGGFPAIVRNFFGYIVEAGNFAVGAVYLGYDWISERVSYLFNRGPQYQSLRTHEGYGRLNTPDLDGTSLFDVDNDAESPIERKP